MGGGELIPSREELRDWFSHGHLQHPQASWPKCAPPQGHRKDEQFCFLPPLEEDGGGSVFGQTELVSRKTPREAQVLQQSCQRRRLHTAAC